MPVAGQWIENIRGLQGEQMTTLSVVPAYIPSRDTMSSIVDVTSGTVVGLVMPSENWTPANVTVQGSPDGVNFYDLHDGMPDTEVLFNVVPGALVAVNPNRLRSCSKIILRSGTRDAPIMQEQTSAFGVIIEVE